MLSWKEEIFSSIWMSICSTLLMHSVVSEFCIWINADWDNSSTVNSKHARARACWVVLISGIALNCWAILLSKPSRKWWRNRFSWSRFGNALFNSFFKMSRKTCEDFPGSCFLVSNSCKDLNRDSSGENSFFKAVNILVFLRHFQKSH